MIFNNSITLYHDSGENYERKFFVRACVFSEEKITGGDGGQTEHNVLLIRIFTYDNPKISSGDRLVLGYSESMLPPEDSYVIMNVTKNCRGSGKTRHFKITAA